jgi:hypothetical protein
MNGAPRSRGGLLAAGLKTRKTQLQNTKAGTTKDKIFSTPLNDSIIFCL